jgi:hypothetical protein
MIMIKNRIAQECLSDRSKTCIILIILSLLGFLSFFGIYSQYATSERLHINLSRHDAQQIARKYIESLGFHLYDFKENIYYEISSDQYAYYQEYNLTNAIQDRLEQFSAASYWSVTFRHPERNERYLVLIDGAGNIFQYRHILPSNVGQGHLPREKALTLAWNFLTEQQIDLA